MKTHSAKAKGKRLQNFVVLKLRNIFENVLESDDIKSQTSSLNGSDVVLSPSARKLISFECECKNVEKLVGSALTSAIEQCEYNTPDGRIPLLIFKKNNNPERVILKLSDFLDIIYPKDDITYSMDNVQKIMVKLEALKQQILLSSPSK